MGICLIAEARERACPDLTCNESGRATKSEAEECGDRHILDRLSISFLSKVLSAFSFVMPYFINLINL